MLFDVLTLLASTALLVFGGLLAVTARDLEVLRLGDDTAEALGVRADATRLRVTLAAVGLVAIATAATGPIAFVAFLSGPIAARLLPGTTGLLLGAGVLADNIWADRVVGFLGDVAVDPLTYMGGVNIMARGIGGAKTLSIALKSLKA